jgi:hypothetical protein
MVWGDGGARTGAASTKAGGAVTTDGQVPPADKSAHLLEPVGAGRAALSGLVAGATGMAAAELLAGLVPGIPSQVTAVGSLVIALQPPGAKDVMASLFGTNDKLVLSIAIVVVGLALASAIGLIGGRHLTWAVALFAAFGVVSLLGAVATEQVWLPPALLNSAVAVLTASAALWWLRWPAGAAQEGLPAPGASPVNTFRRQFLVNSLGVLAGAALAGGLGRYLLDRSHPAGAPPAATLPQATATVAPLTANEQLSAPGLSRLITSNADFYRIDTSLLIPQIDAATWQLKDLGPGRPPANLQLRRPPGHATDRAVRQLIACVSNDRRRRSGGQRPVDRCAAQGDPRRPPAIKPGATQIVGRALDGFTVGFPTSWALDPSREPMVVLGMNRQPLPAEHGYPARLIVPGLFGYVSATKWLSRDRAHHS